MTQWGLDVLFNPAKRHMDEEKLRLQSTREEVGDNSGGRRIDLESGKVTIAKVDDGAAADTDVDDTAGKDTAHKDMAGKNKAGKGKKDAQKELTPAQERALKRRGRSPG